MLISTHFQKFFFGVVCKQLKELAEAPYKYQHPYSGEWFLIDLRKISDEGIYQLLKLVNPNYPKLNDLLPASTKVISSKQMTEHIQWIERWASQNGVTLSYIADEWQRLLEQAGINKEA